MLTLLLLLTILAPQFGSAVFCYECNSRKNNLCKDLEVKSLPGEGTPTPFPPSEGPPIYAYSADGNVYLKPQNVYTCPPEVKSAELKDLEEYKINNCTMKDDLVLLVNCSYQHQDLINVTSFFCRKLDQKLDQDAWVVRKCGWLVPEDTKVNCKYITSFDGKARTSYCSCSKDRCNMANPLLNGVPLVTVLLSLLSIALLM